MIYKSEALHLHQQGTVWMRFTFEALNEIVPNKDKVGVLRSLVTTFENGRKDTFVPIEGGIRFVFKHEQGSNTIREYECTCQFKKGALQVDKLRVQEEIDSFMRHDEGPLEFDIDLSSDDAQTIPAKRKPSPTETALREQLRSSAETHAEARVLSDLDAEGETDDEYVAYMPIASKSAGRAAFVLPDSMKLTADIEQHIDALQEKLSAGQEKSLKFSAAGPSFNALFNRIKDKGNHKDLATYTPSFLTTVRYFDDYRANMEKPLPLKEMLADAVSYLAHVEDAKRKDSRINTSHLNVFLDIFYPNSPARKTIEGLLDKPDLWKKTTKNQKNVTGFLRIGTQIDVHLAKQKLRFADVCRLEDQEAFSPDNQERKRRFLAMRDALMKTHPNDNTYKNLLETLRVILHPVDQDTDLANLIKDAVFDDGKKLPDSSQKQLLRIVSLLAENLADNNVSVHTFVLGVRAFAKSLGATADSMEKFKSAKSPFANSKLNYAAIVKKVAPTTFEILVTHILNNKCMETILQERPEPQG